MLVSSTTTSACMPSAILAAFMPTTPAPSTATLPAGTPETPPSSTPRPPCIRSKQCAPTWGAIPGAPFHNHLVPAAGQLEHPDRRQRNPVFVNLQLGRDTDPHLACLLVPSRLGARWRLPNATPRPAAQQQRAKEQKYLCGEDISCKCNSQPFLIYRNCSPYRRSGLQELP